MSKRKSSADRLVARLSGEDSAFRDRAISALLEFALEQPVSAYLHVEDIVSLVSLACTGPNATSLIERHMRQGWDRNIARCEETQDTIGDGLPEDVQARIPRLILENRPPKAAWTKNAVDPKLLREFFSPVLQEFLMGFARKLPIPGRSGSGGGTEDRSRTGFGIRSRIKESASKRAEKFVEAGKSVLGGLSAEVERQIQTAASEFSQSAERDIRRAFVDRIKSEEGRALLAQIVEQAVAHVLRTPIAELNRDAEELPWDDLWALVPPVVEHNRDRAPVVAAIRDELEALLEVEGARSVRSVLTEAGLLDDTVASLLAHSKGPAAAFFGGQAFRALAEDLLK